MHFPTKESDFSAFVVFRLQEECESLLGKYQTSSFGAKCVSTPGDEAGLERRGSVKVGFRAEGALLQHSHASYSKSFPCLGATRCRKNKNVNLSIFLNYLSKTKKINLDETKIFRLHFFDSSFKYNTT